VTPVVPARDSGPGPLLQPIEAVLQGVAGAHRGMVPGLVVPYEPGGGGAQAWYAASALLDGSRLPALLGWARARWRASPHAAASLAWKYYSYWSVLPVVAGWAAARRVPLLRPADVLVRHGDPGDPLTIGLRGSVGVAVLPGDPLAAGPGRVEVVPGERELLAAVRSPLVEEHLDPLMHTIAAQVRIGTRTLRGSVGSAVAHALLRTGEALPGIDLDGDLQRLLAVAGASDLVRLVPGPHGTPRVERRTCCLAFTLPDPKICRSCCLPAARAAAAGRPGGGRACG
jgi:hypothetical protein